jgi:hypothetical protein
MNNNMVYNKIKQEQETLSNHKEFYKVIKRIAEGDFVLSYANPINHITSLQNKIEVFIKTENGLGHKGKDQRIRDANEADLWLTKVFHDLIDSGVRW